MDRAQKQEEEKGHAGVHSRQRQIRRDEGWGTVDQGKALDVGRELEIAAAELAVAVEAPERTLDD